MQLALHSGTLGLGLLLIAPLLAIGNLVVWWQTREKAMLWWAAGSLAAATAAPQLQATGIVGLVAIVVVLWLYWEGIRSFRRSAAGDAPVPLVRPGMLLLAGCTALGAASDYPEPMLSAAIAGVSALCAYELVARHGQLTRESGYFLGGLFAANALFYLVAGVIAPPAGWAPGLSAPALAPAAYAELLVLLIGWNFGFVMMAMQRYLDLATGLATRDDLTGILNRRAFCEKLRQQMKLAERSGTALSVLAMDLDHFKRVNDTYGHRAGDDVLRAFVRTAGSCLRAVDDIGRVGGEEFVALLPATNAAGALAVAERLRRMQAETPVFYRDASIAVTTSIGVAEFDRHLHDLESLLETADGALYRAKHRGRNCVELAPTAASTAPAVQLVWDSRYTSGHPVIDTEHEDLLAMVNQLVRQSQDQQDVRALLDQFKEMLFWLGKHFRHEEEIFRPTGWAGADRHVEQHRLLETRGHELLAGIADGRYAFGDLLDFLIREVVGSHLSKEDAGFFPVVAAPPIAAK